MQIYRQRYVFVFSLNLNRFLQIGEDTGCIFIICEQTLQIQCTVGKYLGIIGKPIDYCIRNIHAWYLRRMFILHCLKAPLNGRHGLVVAAI